jgi:hypothetical protein
MSESDALTGVLLLAQYNGNQAWHDASMAAIDNYLTSSITTFSNYGMGVTFGYQPFICANHVCKQPLP